MLKKFPPKDIEIKNRIRNNTYDLLEVAYYANPVSDSERKKIILEEIIAEMKVIDFLINLSYDKKIINTI